MQKLNPEQLQKLKKNAKNVRNICILAHVDHGKTTLTDDLISSNGIISPKLAGKIWYMDNTDAEQRKRITMKASAIALLYKHKKKRGEVTTEEDYLINLVDSPGHVDFSGEVSTAVRLTDGGIVVVDVVEGVCIQTQAVIRQAWSEKVHPCLVLNKIDRLVTELHLTPAEAYQRLKTILEQVNVICSTLWTEELAALYEARAAKENAKNGEWVVEDADDSDVYFSPERGNVAFASAGDGWAFRIHQFADLYAEKLGIRRKVLLKTLWGEYYMNAKSKRIVTRNPTGNLTPMFVKFVLNNIWEVYNAILEQNKKKIGTIVKTLKLPVQPGDLRIENVQESAQTVLGKWLPISSAVLGMVVEILPSPVAAQPRRMPKLWSPASALDMKALSVEERRTYRRMVHSVMSCDSSEEAPVIAYVAKVFALDRNIALPPKNAQVIRQPRVPRGRPAPPGESAATGDGKPTETEKEKEKEKEVAPTPTEQAKTGRFKDKEREELEMEAQQLAENDEQEGEDENPMSIKRKTKRKHVAQSSSTDDKMWVAFARIFSGVLKEGSKVYVLGPRYDPRTPNLHRSVVEIKELYMLMGRELERVPSVSAGCVFGIGGVDDIILKTATLSTSKLCPPFTNMTFGFSPIMRVAIEPKNPGDMPKLVEGLRLLNQADPCVEILVQESGEHVILSSGELHLERCLEDLKTRFAPIEMEVYPPVVSFRETIIADLAKDAKTDLVEGATPNKKCIVQIRAVPIPSNITAFLESAANQNVLRQLLVRNQVSLEGKIKAKEAEKAKDEENVPEGKESVEGEQEETEYLETFKKELFAEFEKADNGAFWLNELKNHLWSFGPKRVGANLLLNHVAGYHGTKHWQPLALKLGLISSSDTSPQEGEDESNAIGELIRRYDNSIVSGFQMATAAGPLCEEPVTGVAFIVENVQLSDDGDAEGNGVQGPFWGQIMSTVKEACRTAFMRHGVRIVEPMYLCDLQVSVSALGKATMVLSRRRGRITHQDIRPGTDYFSMRAFLPVLGSFKFAEEIRDTTSGAASAQLVFSHWEVLDSDPFFVPTTEEEKEEFGENVESLPPPLSRTIIDDVRRRKGLAVKEKLFAKAEQQPNMSRKK